MCRMQDYSRNEWLLFCCSDQERRGQDSFKHGAGEAEENIDIATYLAEKHGYQIDLLPNPHNEKSADSFNHTLGYKQEYKVNSKPTKSAIDNSIRSGAEQADHLVIKIESDIDFDTLTRGIRGRVMQSKNISEVIVIRNGKDLVLSRDTITAKGFKMQQEDFKWSPLEGRFKALRRRTDANITQIIGFRLFPTEKYCINFAKKDGVNITYLIFFNLVTCQTQGGRYYWTPFGDGVGITDTISLLHVNAAAIAQNCAKKPGKYVDVHRIGLTQHHVGRLHVAHIKLYRVDQGAGCFHAIAICDQTG